MAKYQFFCIPNSDRKQYSFLDMSSSTFLREKTMILDNGFEVEDDVIYADTPEEAVEKFKSNFIYAVDEYGKADPSYSFSVFLQSLYKMLFIKNK